MKVSIDSKIQKLFNRPLENISEKYHIRHCVHEIERHIKENRDCLLVVHPASLKTQILFAIANIHISPQQTRIVFPEKRSFLHASYSSQHIRIQSFDTYLNDTDKKCAALLIDEGERIDDPIVGVRLESLLIESDPDRPLVLAMNTRPNFDDVAKWLSSIRKRKCMKIHAHCPKTIATTYFTHNGDWVKLLDRKKLNRKVKNHLKTIKKPIPLKKIVSQCMQLIDDQQLRPAIFVLPEITTALDLWNKHPERESTPGQYMTAPQIVSIMNDSPELKDNPFVLQMLKKRAGICFNDHTWLRLLEHFFSLGALDIIYAPLETIQQLHCCGKSLILMAHPKHEIKNSDFFLPLWYDQLMMRSGQTDFMDETTKHYCFCILTDAPDVSPVHVKDYLDSGTFKLQSHYKWDLHSVLGKIARKRSSLDDLNDSFLVATQGAQNNVLFHDAIMDVQAEFPHAKCIPVSAMSFLNNMRIKWTGELTEFSKQIKYSSHKSLETKFQITKFLLDCIPCNDCQHEALCHHRGSKRFRELIDTFYTFQADRTYGHLLLEATIPYYYKLLQQLNWIDSNNEITPKGQLAYQWGSLVNPLFIECLYNNILPKENQRLYSAILAGFLPEKWRFASNIDLRYPSISASYQEFWPHLKETATKMLALGLYPNIPDYQLSCIYYALTEPDDKFEFMQQMKINQMDVTIFLDRVAQMRAKISL
jgi:hypothetical protein